MSKKQMWLAAAGLMAAAVVWRVANWHFSIAPNLEIVTAVTLVAATFLSRRWAVIVPLGILAMSDIVIGNTSILFFTWSAFAAIGLVGLALRRFTGQRGKLVLASLGMGLGGSVFFFLYTNFGVWLLDDHAMYAKTWAGLVQCYVMGLPFYRTQLLGNLVLVPTIFAIAAYGPALMQRARRQAGLALMRSVS